MLNDSCVGEALTCYSVEVEKGRLRLFAKAIGQTDRVHFDEPAARAAGYRSLPLPPTFLFNRTMLALYAGASGDLGDRLTCSGQIVQEQSTALGRRARLALQILGEAGEVKTAGSAIADVPDQDPAIAGAAS